MSRSVLDQFFCDRSGEKAEMVTARSRAVQIDFQAKANISLHVFSLQDQ